MKFRFLVVLAFLFSAIGYAQSSSSTQTVSICGYPFETLQKNLAAKGSSFSYDGAEILKQLDSGFFDEVTNKGAEIKDASKMCILLHELTGLKDKEKWSVQLAAKIIDKYGAHPNRNDSECAVDLAAGIASGNATEIINGGFYLSTARIWTTKLPDYYKTYEPDVYKKEYKNKMTAADGRAKLAMQINQIVNSNTIEKLIMATPEQLSEEAMRLLDKKITNVTDMLKKKVDCLMLTDLTTYMESFTAGTLTVDSKDGEVKQGMIKGTAGYNDKAFSQPSYVLKENPNGSLIKADKAKADQKISDFIASVNKIPGFSKVKDIASLKSTVENMYTKKKCGGTNKKESASVDLGDIAGVPALSEGWFKNWNQCHMSLSSRPGLGAIETCQQVILEGDYIDETAAGYGLKDKDGLVNYVDNGNIIYQLNYYLSALVTTKNARTEVDKAKPEDNENLETDKVNVKKAEEAVVKMNKFLMEDFYTNDPIKNICFGFPVSTAASTTGKSNVTTKIKDLSVTASVDETIEFLTSSNVISVNAGRRSIQQLCVIFNRVKKANVGGYDDYKKFAGLIVDVLHLNPNIDVKAAFSGVEKVGKEAFEILLANAINDKNDKELIRVLSCLEGFGDIHELYQLGILTPDTYTTADAVTDTIIQSSVASDIMYKNVNIKSDNQIIDPINYSPVNKLFTPSNNDKNLPVINNGTDNSILPIVGSDVTSEINKAITELLVGVCNGVKEEEFKKSFEAVLSLIPADIDLDKLKAAIIENVKTTFKSNPACYHLTEEDLLKVIKVAFGVNVDLTKASLEEIMVSGISISDISKDGKDILLAVDANKAYTSKELAVLEAGRFLYEYAVALKSKQKKSNVGNNGVYRSPNMKYDVQSKNINKKATVSVNKNSTTKVSSSNNAGGKYRSSNTKYADAKTYNPNTSKHVKAGGTTSTTKTSANRSTTTKPNTAKTSTTKTSKTNKSSKFETKTVNRTK